MISTKNTSSNNLVYLCSLNCIRRQQELPLSKSKKYYDLVDYYSIYIIYVYIMYKLLFCDFNLNIFLDLFVISVDYCLRHVTKLFI